MDEGTGGGGFVGERMPLMVLTTISLGLIAAILGSVVIGISPLVEPGVGMDDEVMEEEVCGGGVAEGASEERRSSCVAGESWGARWERRLCFSIKETAQSRRSTGVRFAAWTKGSRSCWGD